MLYNDFTAPDGKICRIDSREPKITMITPADKLRYSLVDLDTLFLWRSEADEKNLSPEEADAFFKEKVVQFMKTTVSKQ